MKIFKKLIVISIFVIILLITATITRGFFGFNEVCDGCGLQRSTQKFFWIPIHKMIENDLSKYMLSEFLPKEHKHTWRFATGGGPWVFCSIGDGKHLFKLIHDKDVVPFLKLVEKYEGKKAVNRYVDILFKEAKKGEGSILLSALFSECKDKKDYFGYKHDLELVIKYVQK